MPSSRCSNSLECSEGWFKWGHGKPFFVFLVIDYFPGIPDSQPWVLGFLKIWVLGQSYVLRTFQRGTATGLRKLPKVETLSTTFAGRLMSKGAPSDLGLWPDGLCRYWRHVWQNWSSLDEPNALCLGPSWSWGPKSKAYFWWALCAHCQATILHDSTTRASSGGNSIQD